MAAQREPLAGGRWHYSHGPIDIVVGPDGDLYVADFGTSVIYRIRYQGAK